MNKEELFASVDFISLEREAEQRQQEQPVIQIDDVTRKIIIPEHERLMGVETDQNTERKRFVCKRIVDDNVDLTKYVLRVNWENANRERDQYIVDDVKVEGENITFSWLLNKRAVRYKGIIKFIVCATKTDEKGEVINKWNTTLGMGEVLEGLPVTRPIIIEQPEKDTIAQLLQIVRQTSADAVKDVTAEGDKQVKRVQETGSELRVDVNKNKENIIKLAIKPEVSGNPLIVKDSADFPPVKLELSGSTTQVQTTGKNLGDIPRSIGTIFKLSKPIKSDTGFWVEFEWNAYTDLADGIAVYFLNKNEQYINGIRFKREYKERIHIGPLREDVYFTSINIRENFENSLFNVVRFGIYMNKEDISEPYTGGESAPTFTNPKPFTNSEWNDMSVTGENLFDGKILEGVTLDYNTGKEIKTGTSISTDFIAIPPKCTCVYAWSSDNSNKKVRAYDKDKNYMIIGTNGWGTRTSTKIKILDERVRFLRISVDEGMESLPYPMMLSLTDLSYETPIGFVETLKQKIQLSEWDKIKLVDGVWKVERNSGLKTFNGSDSEHWRKENSGELNAYRITIENMVSIKEATIRFIYCDKLKGKSFSNKWEYGDICVTYGKTIAVLYNIPTLDGFKSFLRNNPITVIYKTDKIIYETLPQEAQNLLNKITTYYPNTIISTNEGITLDLQYVADTKNYTDNKNKALLDRIAELEQAIIK